MSCYRTLLIVDDDETFLRGFARRWKHLGRVYTAVDVSSAVFTVKDEPIDLAVVDFHLPATDGVDVLKHLKAHLKVTRVVVASSDMTATLQAVSLEAGATAALDKATLENVVVSILNGTWDDSPTSHDRLDYIVQAHVVQTLARYGGNHTLASRALGISRSTLDRHLGYVGSRMPIKKGLLE